MIMNAGKFNSEWESKKLNQLGVFSRGVSKHRPRNDSKLFDNGNIPLIQTGDIKDSNLYIESNHQFYNEFGLSQSKLWPKNTLCITIAANIAESGILKYPMCFPDSVVGFVADKEETFEEFMYYVFEYIKQSLQRASTGSTQDNINIDFLTNINFKIPDLSIQKNIFNILGAIDKKILLNNHINDNLHYSMMVA